MEKKSTDELDALLVNVKTGGLNDYLKENRKFVAEGEKAFYYFMKDVLDEKHLKLKDLYLYAGVSESYGSKIITMEKHARNRDLILRFCLAGRFTLEETNRALKLYGFSELYAKQPRDACLIVAIQQRIYDFDQIDDILESHGFQKITAKQAED